MAITTSTGIIDYATSFIIPQSNSTWAATSGTSWANFRSWNITPANPLIWVTDRFDFGRIGYFNIKIDAYYTGQLQKYEVWTSNTGEFAGEETYHVITEGDTHIPAFLGRYAVVAVWIYDAGFGSNIKELTVKLSDQSIVLDYTDVVTSELPTWPEVETSATVSAAYVLDLGRAASSVISAHFQPHFLAPGPYMSTGYASEGYASSGAYRSPSQYEYFEDINYGAVAIPSIVRRSIISDNLPNKVGTAFAVQDQNGDYIHAKVDVRVKVLPEQYMQNGQLLAR